MAKTKVKINGGPGWAAEHREALEKLRNFCFMDDFFMTAALKRDYAAVACILQIILQDPFIQVVNIFVQDTVPNLYGRSVRLDIHAVDKDGRHFDVEIQKESSGVSARRSRHNGAILDMECVRKGGDPNDFPEVFIIFLCEHDPFKAGKPVYHVDKCVRETQMPYDDGMHYVYVNAAYRGNDDFGRLARDLHEKDPEKIYFKPLAHAAARVKSDPEGVTEMCKIMEDWLQQGIEQGIELGKELGRADTLKETVRTLLKFMNVNEIVEKMGYSPEFVMDVAKE